MQMTATITVAITATAMFLWSTDLTFAKRSLLSTTSTIYQPVDMRFEKIVREMPPISLSLTMLSFPSIPSSRSFFSLSAE